MCPYKCKNNCNDAFIYQNKLNLLFTNIYIYKKI